MIMIINTLKKEEKKNKEEGKSGKERENLLIGRERLPRPALCY